MSKLIDEKILAELRQDSRIPVTTLANRVGRSRTAVQARINRLQQDGRIQRYTIDEPGRTKDSDVGAMVLISVTVRSKSQDLLSHLRGLPQVIGCFGIAGDFDFALLLSRMENAELQKLLEQIYLLDGVRKTETTLALYREF